MRPLKRLNQPTRFFKLTPPTGRMQGQFPQRGSLNKNDGHKAMELTCPVCLLRFHRPASHVARNKSGIVTCSLACRGIAFRKRVKIECQICGKPFDVIKSFAEQKRITTCGAKCKSIKTTQWMNWRWSQSFGHHEVEDLMMTEGSEEKNE
jgi:hypothetical protein